MPGPRRRPGPHPLYGETMGRIAIRLPTTLLDRLNELASARGVSRCVIIRSAIERFELDEDQGELDLEERVPA